MKTNQLVRVFLCLFFILTLQGYGQGKDVPSPEKMSSVATTNNSTSSGNDAIKTFNETKGRAEHGDAKAQFKLGNCYYKGDGVATNYIEAVSWYRKAAEQNYAKAQYYLGFCYEAGRGVTQNAVEAKKWYRLAAESYRKAAEQNDAEAQYELGDCYNYGLVGMAKDKVEAVKWYRKAAEQDNAEAQYELGTCYQLGQGVKKDAAEAAKWYRKAAEQGNASSQEDLGEAYRDGSGVPKDNAEAVKWFRKSADQGDANGQLALGVMYELGRGVPQDSSEAYKWFHKAAGNTVADEEIVELFLAAEKGNAKSQYDLGYWFYNGFLVPEDATEAVKWWRKAAEQGNADAQVSLGAAYENGRGVETNVLEAVKWWRKAAEQGYADAQFNLATMYDNGNGVPKDMAEAAKWYRMAADKGNAFAQGRLGMMYLTADGIERNYSEAFKLCSKAAEQGDKTGLIGLSWCYDGGFGVPVDYAKAVEITRRFAEAGEKFAQRNLGMNYEQGHGVRQDFVEAYKWYNLAAANEDISLGKMMEKDGIEMASTMRDRLAQQMTSAQIAEAQQLSREFRPRKKSGSDNSTSPENPTASGTGFFITDDGYLISNYHVVKDAAKVRLVTSAGTISAKVVQVDAANDLALLKAKGQFAPLPIAASRGVKLGGTVATIGFPDPGLQGFSPKLAKGEIASLSGAADDARYFQISVPVQPGNSGGALVDEHGNVIGIVSAKLDASAALAASGALPENVNYAVKSSFLLGFLESVPAVSAKLKEPITADRKFEDVVKSAQDAAVLVLVY